MLVLLLRKQYLDIAHQLSVDRLGQIDNKLNKEAAFIKVILSDCQINVVLDDLVGLVPPVEQYKFLFEGCLAQNSGFDQGDLDGLERSIFDCDQADPHSHCKSQVEDFAV